MKTQPFTWEEAVAESEARGEVRAALNAILKVIESRFGAPPASLRQSLVEIADPARLFVLFDKALDAQSLEEFETAVSHYLAAPAPSAEASSTK